jgi:hypothetical protein
MFPLPTRTLIATGVALFVVAALVTVTLMWGQSRYEAGKDAADAQWLKASARLEQQQRAAGTFASSLEVIRIEEYTADLAEQQEMIDEAVSEGRSPFDVLFGRVPDDADVGSKQASR